MANQNERGVKGIQGRIRLNLVSPNAAVERRRDTPSSAQQAHNEMARLLRVRDDV
jgi:hypothetical protein